MNGFVGTFEDFILVIFSSSQVFRAIVQPSTHAPRRLEKNMPYFSRYPDWLTPCILPGATR
jgi:hypothetical protein